LGGGGSTFKDRGGGKKVIFLQQKSVGILNRNCKGRTSPDSMTEKGDTSEKREERQLLLQIGKARGKGLYGEGSFYQATTPRGKKVQEDLGVDILWTGGGGGKILKE